MIKILKQCQRELKVFPETIREDLAFVLARLEEGHLLSMPLSRPIPSIGQKVHELRIKDRSGAYRVIYVLITEKGTIHLLHAFKKKTRETPLKYIELAKKRLKEVLKT